MILSSTQAAISPQNKRSHLFNSRPTRALSQTMICGSCIVRPAEELQKLHDGWAAHHFWTVWLTDLSDFINLASSIAFNPRASLSTAPYHPKQRHFMASVSPYPSPDSEDGSVAQVPRRTNSISESFHPGSIGMADSPHNRRSIQFNIGGPQSQPPSRPGSATGRKNSQPEVHDKELKVPGRTYSPPPPQ